MSTVPPPSPSPFYPPPLSPALPPPSSPSSPSPPPSGVPSEHQLPANGRLRKDAPPLPQLHRRSQRRLRLHCQGQQAEPLGRSAAPGGAAPGAPTAMSYMPKDEVDGGPPCAPGGAAKTRRPDNTAFKQQRLPAWQPILTAGTVLPTFFIIGLIFIPIGIGIFVTSNNIREIEVRRRRRVARGGAGRCPARGPPGRRAPPFPPASSSALGRRTPLLASPHLPAASVSPFSPPAFPTRSAVRASSSDSRD